MKLYLSIEYLVFFWKLKQGNFSNNFPSLQNLKYDLGDCTLWEYMFPSNDKPLLQIPDEDDLLDGLDEDDVSFTVLGVFTTSQRG